MAAFLSNFIPLNRDQRHQCSTTGWEVCCATIATARHHPTPRKPRGHGLGALGISVNAKRRAQPKQPLQCLHSRPAAPTRSVIEQLWLRYVLHSTEPREQIASAPIGLPSYGGQRKSDGNFKGSNRLRRAGTISTQQAIYITLSCRSLCVFSPFLTPT